MSAPPTCAATGCDNPVVRRHGQPGRPPIYCSPGCRPSRKGRPDGGQVIVEVDQDEPHGDALHHGRSWVVRLRRGRRTVVVGRDLGRFSATVLSGELRQLLQPGVRQEGDTIE